jgi:aspartate/methionine/tyrosine aminotransferase
VLLPFPVFSAMPVVARAWGLGVKAYHMSRERGFRQPAEWILAAVDSSTRLVLVNSPHNPTGAVMPAEELAHLAGELAKQKIPLVVDEVYHPLYFDRAMPSAASVPNTIVISDMSKALSLPGLRTGWLIDRDAQRRKRLVDARSYFTISGSPVLEMLAAVALRSRVKILARLESVARANLGLLDEFMQTHRDTLSWVRPAGGTVSFPWFRDGRNARPVCEALAQAGVLVAPGDCFDAPDHFRLGFGLQENGFLEALAIFSRVLASQ